MWLLTMLLGFESLRRSMGNKWRAEFKASWAQEGFPEALSDKVIYCLYDEETGEWSDFKLEYDPN